MLYSGILLSGKLDNTPSEHLAGRILATSHDRIHPKWWFMWGKPPNHLMSGWNIIIHPDLGPVSALEPIFLEEPRGSGAAGRVLLLVRQQLLSGGTRRHFVAGSGSEARESVCCKLQALNLGLISTSWCLDLQPGRLGR